MDTNAALALLDESPGTPPVPADSQRLSQGLRSKYADRITGSLMIPGRTASWAPLPDELPTALAAALRSRGIDRLYSHQAQAWDAVRAGKDVVVVTPTASGKS